MNFYTVVSEQDAIVARNGMYKFTHTPSRKHLRTKVTPDFHLTYSNQRTNGPVNAHLISWPTKAQNIQNLENI